MEEYNNQIIYFVVDFFTCSFFYPEKIEKIPYGLLSLNIANEISAERQC